MEGFKARGEVHVKIFRAGRLIEEWRDNNLVVNAGRTAMTKLFGEGLSNQHVTKIGFGTSGVTAHPEDTTLTDAYVKAIGVVSYPEVNSVQFSWSLETDESNGKTIRELGLINDSGALLARRTREPIEKTEDLRLEGTWKIFF